MDDFTERAQKFAESLIDVSLYVCSQELYDPDYREAAREQAIAFAKDIEALIDARIAAALSHR